MEFSEYDLRKKRKNNNLHVKINRKEKIISKLTKKKAHNLKTIFNKSIYLFFFEK